MSIASEIEIIENEVAKVEAIIRPLTDMRSQLIEEVRLADEAQSYTGKRPDCMFSVNAYTIDNHIAEIPIPSDILLKYVEREISSKSECVSESKEKLSKIKDILS